MKKSIITLLLSLICIVATAETPAVNTTLQGTVRDAVDGEPLIGVTIFIPELKATTITDINGHYKLEHLPQKTITVQVSYVGHQTIIKEVDLTKATNLDFTMHESNAMMNEVVVTGIAGSQLLKDSPTPVAIMTQRELLTTSSTNIIDAISRQPGLAQITTGSGISKPVIRGLGYNRIVTVADGIRQEGQQWGDEHGIELDPQTVGSIEILKGPASLMYGSDAMAGVVIFHNRPTLPNGKIQGSTSAEYQTNNGLWAYSLNMGGNQKGYVWDLRWSEKAAHAYKNKVDDRVPGTQFAERALSGMGGINRRWGYTHLRLSAYHLTPTMTEGGEEAEELSEDDLTTYHHGFPYQQIYHYKAVSENSIYIGDGTLRITAGYQNNRRQEFEDEDNPDESGLYFMLHTLTCDTRYSWQNEKGLKLNAGIATMWQQSVNKGEEFLIPDYTLNDLGAYATTGYKWGTWTFSGGMRVDRRHVRAFALEDRFANISRTFSAISGSAGAVCNLGHNMNLRFNVARGFRAPNLSELSSNGEHEGTFRYEVGNSQLKPEYSWQADAGWDYNSAVVSAQLSVFANIIDNYIFARRDADILTEGLPTYIFAQGDARLIGCEATIDFHPVERLHFENSFSYVDARQEHQSADRRYLPRTPAPRWVSELSFDIVRDGQVLNNTFVRLGVECYLRQDHVYSADNTETPTPSYTLVNLAAGTDIMRHHRNICTISITADNITNRAYQNHLSRLKYAGYNASTGRYGYFNMGRNIGVKVLIPLNLR